MLIRALILSSFVATATGQAVAPPGGCLICGDGKVVTEPDAVFEFPQQPKTPCGILQSAGLAGSIPLDQCELIPPFISICECAPGDLPAEPTTAPEPAPFSPAPILETIVQSAPFSAAPVLDTSVQPVPCPAVPNDKCSVCGPDLCVTLPDAIFDFPDQPTVTCGTLEVAGLNDFITEGECALLPEIIMDICGCASSIPAPPTVAPVTAAPILGTNVPPVAVSTPCRDIPDGKCSVCGPGLCVTDPDAIFDFPDQPTVTCGTLEGAGLDDLISPAECELLPEIIVDICGCASSIPAPSTVASVTAAPVTAAPVTTAPVDPTSAPTATPALATTIPPVGASTPCRDIPDGKCSVCGPGLCVTDPDAIFDFPDQPAISCGTLEGAGLDDLISPAECELLPEIIADICGCASSIPAPSAPVTAAPVTAAPVTAAPVTAAPVTAAPVTAAPVTAAPVTAAPVTAAPVDPTSAPTAKPALATTVPPVGASIPCPEIPDGKCSVCGHGLCVTDPDAIFDFPDQPTVTCGVLEEAGLNDLISSAECAFLPLIIADTCACMSSIPVAPTAAPVVPSNPCPEAPEGGCSICGSGLCVTDPDAIFSFPNQPALSCGRLQDAGFTGFIPLDECPFLPEFVIETCACMASIPIAPTPAPSPLPTEPATSCPDIPDGGCSICGPGFCVTDPDSIFAFPNEPEVPCGTLQSAGLTGMISLGKCALLPDLVMDTCACKQAVIITPTPAPTDRSIPCPETPEGGCSVCGEGKCVTTPDVIFSFPGQPSASCAAIEGAGFGGIIPLDQCEFLPDLLLDPCSCSPAIPLPPTHAPTSSPTDNSTPCPDVPEGGCSICGDGFCVTDPDASFDFLGQPLGSCGELQQDGFNGKLPTDECTILPDLVFDACDCMASIPVVPTEAPVATNAPTDAPVAPPTDKPSLAPSDAPVTDAPTHPPIPPKTDSPTHLPSAAPSAKPTDAPTMPPTIAPTAPPTNAPTVPPTDAPTAPPTNAPTAPPTDAPVVPPTDSPVVPPTDAPFQVFTPSPTRRMGKGGKGMGKKGKKTSAPTADPSSTPSYSPSSTPSSVPSNPPTHKKATRKKGRKGSKRQLGRSAASNADSRGRDGVH